MCGQTKRLQKLLEAGMEWDDAQTSLIAYDRNPKDPGADGMRAKAILEKDSNEQQ